MERTSVLSPTESNWLESAGYSEDARGQGFSPEKLRDLHFDVLIALTARSHGARLITSQPGRFELIRGYREYSRECGNEIRTGLAPGA